MYSLVSFAAFRGCVHGKLYESFNTLININVDMVKSSHMKLAWDCIVHCLNYNGMSFYYFKFVIIEFW